MPGAENRQVQRNEYQIKLEQKQQLIDGADHMHSVEQYREDEKDNLVTENRRILELLDEESLFKNDEDTTFREKKLLRNRLTRNYAGMVILDTKWYGEGSPEMVRVQEQTKDLFRLLDTPIGQEAERRSEIMSEILKKFDDAIAACQNYEDNKNPWFSTGKRRKEQVTLLKGELVRQRKVFYFSMLPYAEGQLDNLNIRTPQDLLLVSYRENVLDVEEKKAAKQEVEPLTLEMPKNQKSVAVRKAAYLTLDVVKDRQAEKEKGEVKYLKKYTGYETQRKLKLDQKNAKDERKKIIDKALSGPPYAFYKELKLDKNKNYDKNKIDDPALLALLIKTMQGGVQEHNKKVMEAVFTKGITADNLKMEKVKPFIDGLVEEFLSAKISAKMLEDDYIAPHALEICRFIKLASFLNDISKDHGQERENSPFRMYYFHSTPPEVRSMIEQRIKAAMPLFTVFKMRLQDFEVTDEEMDLDTLGSTFKNNDPVEMQRVWEENRQAGNQGAGAQAVGNEEAARQWREKAYHDALLEWEKNEDKFIKCAKSFGEKKNIQDWAAFSKKFNERFGANLYYKSEIEQVAFIQERVFDQRVQMFTNQDAAAAERVFEQIVKASFTSMDFNEPLNMISPVKYNANMQLIKLVETLSADGRNVVEAYRSAMIRKVVRCNLSVDDFQVLEAKIADIKKAALLYRDFEEIINNPFFNEDEFEELTKKLPLDEAWDKISELNDNLPGTGNIAYYRKVMQFHRDVIENRSAQLEEAAKENTAIADEDYSEGEYTQKNEALTQMVSQFGERNDIASKYEKADINRRITKNRIVMLYNDKHTLKSDSTEMTAIKTALVNLDKACHDSLKNHGIDVVHEAYEKVIGAIEYYEDVKNPWFPEGKRRLRKVRELKQALISEQEMLRRENEKALGGGDVYPAGVKCANDLLLGLAQQPKDTLTKEFAVNKAVMFANMQYKTGVLPENITDIRDAYSDMILALQTDIHKADKKDISARQITEDQLSGVAETIYEVVNRCDIYLSGKERESLTGTERNNFDHIRSLRDELNYISEKIFEASRSIAFGNMEGTTYTDALGIVLEGMKEADSFSVKLNGVASSLQKESMNKFLTVARAVYTYKKERKDKAKYTPITDVVEEKAAQWLKSDEVKRHLMEQRVEIGVKLYEAYEEAVKKPVPRQFLKNNADDPMDEKLRRQFALIMLRVNPWFDKLQDMDSFFNLVQATQVAEDYRAMVDQYNASLDPVKREKFIKGTQIGMSMEGLISETNKLKKEAVQSFIEKVDKLEAADAGERLKEYVDNDFMKCKAGDLEEAKGIIEREYEQLRAAQENLRADIQADFEKVRNITSFQKEMSKVEPLSEIKDDTVTSRIKLEEITKEEEEKVQKQKIQLQRIVHKKEEQAKVLTTARNSVTTKQIQLQDDLDINIAKKTDFTTVKALSAFADKMDKDQFAELVKSYTGAGFESEVQKRDARFELLQKLADDILEIEEGSFDLESNEGIIENASEFELMGAKISAFKPLLGKNPMLKIKLEEAISEDGIHNKYEMVMSKLHVLGNISRYYRVKKLILTNPLYQTMQEDEVSVEEDANDTYEMKYLKKLQAYLNKLAGKFNEDEEEDTYTQSEDEALEKEIMALEFERLFIPPKDLKLTIKNIPRQNDKKYFALSLGGKDEGDKIIQNYVIQNNPDSQAVKNGIDELADHDKNQGVGFGDPMFKKAKSFDPKTLFGENFSRQTQAFCTVYNYGQTPAELVQIMKHMTVMSSKNYNEDDPEALAYYESCFIESAVKYEAFMYAAVMRMLNGFGDLPFLLHPKDLVIQYTPLMRATLMATATITNHITTENKARFMAFMEKFNTSGQYPMDLELFDFVGNAYSAVVVKMNSYMKEIHESVMLNDGKFLPKGTSKKVRTWCGKQDDPEIKKYEDPNKSYGPEVLSLYLESEESEWIRSQKLFDLKDSKGRYLFEEALTFGGLACMTTSQEELKKFMTSNKVKHTSQEDVDAYEKKLKDEKYVPIGPKNDPYMIGAYKNKYEG